MIDALALLIQERDRLNRAIEILQSEPKRRGRKPGSAPATAAGPKKPRRRRRMSPAARKAVSERMKKYWAGRRKAKRKG